MKHYCQKILIFCKKVIAVLTKKKFINSNSLATESDFHYFIIYFILCTVTNFTYPYLIAFPFPIKSVSFQVKQV